MRNKLTYFGNPWIGLFVKTNDRLTIVPKDALPKVVENIEQNLKTEVTAVSVGSSGIVGAYLAMNSSGIILPNLATAEELKVFKELGLNVYKSEEKSNAHGNNIAANDKGGIINPRISSAERKKMEDVLGVELVPMMIAKYATVGSCCISGNNGFLAHFGASDNEMDAIADALKVKGEKGSVNMGTGFVSLGIIGNVHGYIAGEATSAYEMGRAESALGYLNEV
jgi:translation initiation factor 6